MECHELTAEDCWTGNRECFGPIRVLVRGTSYSLRAAERRWERPPSSDTGVTMSEMYSGAVPMTTECMMTLSLNRSH
jgi:hypothetical protein